MSINGDNKKEQKQKYLKYKDIKVKWDGKINSDYINSWFRGYDVYVDYNKSFQRHPTFNLLKNIAAEDKLCGTPFKFMSASRYLGLVLIGFLFFCVVGCAIIYRVFNPFIEYYGYYTAVVSGIALLSGVIAYRAYIQKYRKNDRINLS